MALMRSMMEEKISEELIAAGRRYESLFVPALFQAWTKHLVVGADPAPGMLAAAN